MEKPSKDRYKRIIAGLVLACLPLFALSYKTLAERVTTPFDEPAFKVPPAYKDVFDNYRSSFKRMSGFEYSGLHWQNFVVVYVAKDKSVYKKNYFEYLKFLDYDEEEEDEPLELNYQPYPQGAVVVKENFSTAGGRPDKPLTLTVMVKMEPGYDAAHNDWLYIQSDVEGNIIMDGKYEESKIFSACSDCHGNIKERDYIFSTFMVTN